MSDKQMLGFIFLSLMIVSIIFTMLFFIFDYNMVFLLYASFFGISGALGTCFASDADLVEK